MAVSVADSVSRAIEHTSMVLFKPFKIEKWFVLGFCAWLAYLGEGGGPNCNFPGGGGGGGGPGPATTPGEFEDWVKNNLDVIITIAAVLVLVILAITLLVTWIKSRAAFMFLDGVARNRGAVVEPWKTYRRHGNSLFLFTIVFSLIGMVTILGIIAVALATAWPDIRAQQWGQSAFAAIFIGGPLLLLAISGFALIGAILHDFIIPVMYVRDQRILPAWGIWWRELVPGHVGAFVLFYLMRILLAIAIAIMMRVVTCATCCIAALPYIGTVIMLPLFVFKRCYSLSFLEQFGPEWRVFRFAGTHCLRCGYNLNGLPAAGVCPECGTPYAAAPPPLAAEPM